MGKRSDKKRRRKRELQRRSILEDATILKSTQNEKIKNNYKNIVKTIIHLLYVFLNKVAFPLSCFGYIVIMSTGFLDDNSLWQYYMSLFMALFSLGISIVFSDIFDLFFNKVIKLIEKCLKGGLGNEIRKLLKLLISIAFAFGLWVVATKKPDNLNIPIVTKENVGNIITWLSIIIFSIDKAK